MGAQMRVRGAVLSDPAKSAPLHTESVIANCRSPSSRWSGYEMRDNKYRVLFSRAIAGRWTNVPPGINPPHRRGCPRGSTS